MGKMSGKVATNIYLPTEIRHGLGMAAATLDTSITQIVEDLVVQHLDAYVAAKQAEKAPRAEPPKG
jgi:hypothetical protein